MVVEMKREHYRQIYLLGVTLMSLTLIGFILTPVAAQSDISPVLYTKFGMTKPNIIPYVHSIASRNNIVYLTQNVWNGSQYIYYLLGLDPNTGHIVENRTIDVGIYNYIGSMTSYDNKIYFLHENYTQVDENYYITYIVTRLNDDLTLTKVFSVTFNNTEIEAFTFTYDGTYMWLGTRNFSTNNSYLCAFDSQGNVVKNITFSPNNEAAGQHYYLRSLYTVSDNILALDSDGILWDYNKVADNVSRAFNVTDSLVDLLINREQMDSIRPLSITANDTALWIAVDGIQVNPTTHTSRIFHYLVTYDLKQVVPTLASPSSAAAPVVGGTMGAASAGGMVSSTVAATTAVVGTASVAAAATSVGSTTATGSTVAISASQAGGGKTDLLRQIKDLFSLRKLKGLFERKKKKSNEEGASVQENTSQQVAPVEGPIKPNFSLGAGVIALFGLISGIILGLVASAQGGLGSMFPIIGATIGFPLAIFGIITSGFVLFLYFNKELTLKTLTLIIILVSFISALYGLYSSSFALFGYLVGTAAIGYLIISVGIGLLIAGTQLYNFINTIPELH